MSYAVGRSAKVASVWGKIAPVVFPLAMVVRMIRVKAVESGSIAEELGIVSGTELLTVNGRELADFLDWEFLTADEELVVEARLPDGDEIVYEIERPEGESMGVELE